MLVKRIAATVFNTYAYLIDFDGQLQSIAF